MQKLALSFLFFLTFASTTTLANFGRIHTFDGNQAWVSPKNGYAVYTTEGKPLSAAIQLPRGNYLKILRDQVVLDVSFSPDDQYLVAETRDKAKTDKYYTKVYHLPTQELVFEDRLGAHGHFSKDSNFYAYRVMKNNQVRVLKLGETRKETELLKYWVYPNKGNHVSRFEFEFSLDSKWLYVWSFIPARANLLELTTGKEWEISTSTSPDRHWPKRSLGTPPEHPRLISSDSKYFVIYKLNGSFELRRTHDNKVMFTYKRPEKSPSRVRGQFSNNGKFFISLNQDDLVVVHLADFKSKIIPSCYRTDERQFDEGEVMSETGTWLLPCEDYEGEPYRLRSVSLHNWPKISGEVLFESSNRYSIPVTKFSPKENYVTKIFGLGRGAEMEVVELSTDRTVKIPGEKAFISPDEKYLFSTEFDTENAFRVHDLETGTELEKIELHYFEKSSFSRGFFTGDNRYFLLARSYQYGGTTDDFSRLYVYDLQARKLSDTDGLRHIWSMRGFGSWFWYPISEKKLRIAKLGSYY